MAFYKALIGNPVIGTKIYMKRKGNGKLCEERVSGSPGETRIDSRAKLDNYGSKPPQMEKGYRPIDEIPSCGTFAEKGGP